MDKGTRGQVKSGRVDKWTSRQGEVDKWTQGQVDLDKPLELGKRPREGLRSPQGFSVSWLCDLLEDPRLGELLEDVLGLLPQLRVQQAVQLGHLEWGSSAVQ